MIVFYFLLCDLNKTYSFLLFGIFFIRWRYELVMESLNILLFLIYIAHRCHSSFFSILSKLSWTIDTSHVILLNLFLFLFSTRWVRVQIILCFFTHALNYVLCIAAISSLIYERSLDYSFLLLWLVIKCVSILIDRARVNNYFTVKVFSISPVALFPYVEYILLHGSTLE